MGRTYRFAYWAVAMQLGAGKVLGWGPAMSNRDL
jgi:hypothetical protein